MIKIKNILCDVLDYAYADSDKLEQYKRVYVEMINECRKGFHGDYNGVKHYIRVFNLYRDDASIVATTLHELAHHVDYVNRGSTNHGKEFYEVFECLLHTALNMGLFDKEQFLNATRDASDSNKIAKMIADYIPEDISYKKDVVTIEVRNCYEKKDILKARGGYTWNKVNKTWEKEVTGTELDDEKNFLKNEEFEFCINEHKSLQFTGKTCIIAGKGSYDVKDKLREEGFFYDAKKKCWKKEVDTKSLQEYVMKYPTVKFYYDK